MGNLQGGCRGCANRCCLQGRRRPQPKRERQTSDQNCKATAKGPSAGLLVAPTAWSGLPPPLRKAHASCVKQSKGVGINGVAGTCLLFCLLANLWAWLRSHVQIAQVFHFCAQCVSRRRASEIFVTVCR